MMAESPEGTAEVERSAAERLTFFTDAVAAIALTLLAIELPVPEGFSPAELWQSVGENSYEYLAFAISFVVIAAHWSTHHDLFRWVVRVDDGLRRLNFWWLLTIVLVPFVSKLLSDPGGPGGDEPDTSLPVRFAAYAAVQVMANVVFQLMVRRMAAHHLVRPDTPEAVLSRIRRGAIVLGTSFAVSIPLFFVWDRAWLVWIILPTLNHLWHRIRRARTGRR